MKYFNIIIIILCGMLLSLNRQENKYDYVIDEIKITNIEKLEEPVINIPETINTFYGNITAYTPYCDGCIGITAYGYDVRNNIYYNDNQYGNIRISAADKAIPFGTIIKISNIDEYDDIISIVLDRGSAIGYDTNAQLDLLFDNENMAINFGRKYNVKFEILREGF